MEPNERVPASSVRFLVEGLRALGYPPEDVAGRIGVEPASFEADGWLRRSACIALLDLALEWEGADAGLRVGDAIPPGALGLVDHLTGAAPTCQAALEDLVRYFALVATGVRLSLRHGALTLDLPDWPPATQRLLAEMTFAIVDQRLTLRAGQPFGPIEVAFPWPEPEATTLLRDRWPSVAFDRPSARMLGAPDRLEAPLSTADASLRDLLVRYASAELNQRPDDGVTVARRVEHHLIDTLPAVATAADVARALALSERSLRRALATEGTTFTEVRDRCWQRIAEDALRDPMRTIGEVAWLLGYSEPSAFHRAFRRWTGSTPERFRSGRHPTTS